MRGWGRASDTWAIFGFERTYVARTGRGSRPPRCGCASARRNVCRRAPLFASVTGGLVMAQDSSGGGSNAWLAFLVGALVVVVAVIAFAMYGGRTSKTVDINVKAPTASAPAAPATPSGSG